MPQKGQYTSECDISAPQPTQNLFPLGRLGFLLKVTRSFFGNEDGFFSHLKTLRNDLHFLQ